ncbi:MAG: class I tRNA ligase family protein [Patescibacteria group bacterium]
MEGYDHKTIEEKWRAEWEKNHNNIAKDLSDKKKTYLLVEFPYPSGEGLHVGHVRGYTALDVVARKHRRQNESVLFPIGWDAFGLPTENYALKTGRDPREVTKENTDVFRGQMKRLGLSFNWNHEVNTTDPAYYKWTQWIFLQLHKHKLAYKAKTTINWCPKDKIGLANEEVVDGCCERCGTLVEKREREQWMLAITKYAKRLYDDLDTVNYIERAKVGQRNWIGPSEGAVITFEIRSANREVEAPIEVFTTRPDTLFGATYLVISPEHPLITKLESRIVNHAEVQKYVEEAKKKPEIERTAEGKEKTGVLLEGIRAINPGNKEEIPVFIADYVLASYGTGAIMAVPAHDERDFEFAKKYELSIKQVIAPETGVRRENEEERNGGVGIVFDPARQRYAVGRQKNGLARLFSGGVDDGESIQEGTLREVAEESGLFDFKHVEYIGKTYAHYHNSLRNVNRLAWASAFLVILDSSDVKEVRHESHEDFELEWITGKDLWNNLVEHNIEGSTDHWLWFLRQGIGRAIDLGYDTESDKAFFAQSPYTGEGILTDSGEFSGMKSEEAKKKITEFVGGEMKTTYKLRDWVFSRQRYWGEPIPLINCEKCGWVAVPEKDLPVTLPIVEKYQPTDTGDSPLANISEWVNTTCPTCGGSAKRETDVMPNWAGSSWYYLRYCDPTNKETLADFEKMKYWLPVDWYNGGMEHTTLHLLYSRFWHKFLYDIKVVPTPEPYARRTSHGLILAEGGEKMSKSKGNVVNPDDIIKQFGADTLRVYEMFMGPFDQAIAWSTDGLVGVRRFLERILRMSERLHDIPLPQELETLLNQSIKKVGDDIESLRMNTAVSQLMIFANALQKEEKIPKEAFLTFILLLAPLAPFLSEEIWQGLGGAMSVHKEAWPKHDPSKLVGEEVTIGVQINGKIRGSISCPAGTPEATVLALARAEANVEKWLNGKDIVKIIYIQDKILNVVARDA